MPRVLLGTESSDILSIPILADGTLDVDAMVRVPSTPNPLGLPSGGPPNNDPPGVNTEWLVAHPNGRWLYAFCSFWDHAPSEVVTFAIDESAPGGLTEVDRKSTLGYQAAHAVLLATTASCRTLGVVHYLGLPHHLRRWRHRRPANSHHCDRAAGG